MREAGQLTWSGVRRLVHPLGNLRLWAGRQKQSAYLQGCCEAAWSLTTLGQLKKLSGLSGPVFWSWWTLLGIHQVCREMALPSAWVRVEVEGGQKRC